MISERRLKQNSYRKENVMTRLPDLENPLTKHERYFHITPGVLLATLVLMAETFNLQGVAFRVSYPVSGALIEFDMIDTAGES